MRLKEDSSSYKAAGIKRREYRQQPVDEIQLAIRKSKKDTKRWCKGVKGREHDYEIRVPKNSPLTTNSIRLYVCKKCGKLDHTHTEYWCKNCEVWYSWEQMWLGHNHSKVLR